jgi:hypothetical protein
MRAGTTILKAFRRNPMVFHASLVTPVGAALRLIAGADWPERRGA